MQQGYFAPPQVPAAPSGFNTIVKGENLELDEIISHNPYLGESHYIPSARGMSSLDVDTKKFDFRNNFS